MKNNTWAISSYKSILIIFLIFLNLSAYSLHESLQDLYGDNSVNYLEILNATERELIAANPGDVKQIFRDSPEFSVKLYEGDNLKYIEKIFSFKETNLEMNKNKAINEFLAYQFDKQIGLKMVPPTIYFQNPSKINSYIVRQLYIDKSFTPDEEDVLSENNYSSSDSDGSSSSSSKNLEDYLKNDTALIIFDKLLGMRDREFNNYLISYDGTVAAIDHESLFEGAIFKNFSNQKYFSKNDIRSFFYEANIYERFMSMNWENWVNVNLPQGMYTEEQKKIFIQNLKKLKHFAELTIKHDGSEKEFFRKAKQARETSLNVKKLLFLTNQKKIYNSSSISENREYESPPIMPFDDNGEESYNIPDFDLLLSDEC